MTRRFRIGVFPAAERTARSRLLDALANVFPVCFEARQPGAWRDLDAAVVFAREDAEPDVPPAGMSLFVAGEDELPRPGAMTVLRLAAEPHLPSMLAGQLLYETRDPQRLPAGGRNAQTLATRDGRPVWTKSVDDAGSVHAVALAPRELASDEHLRDRLTGGRFLALLALVQFLRELTAERAYAPPPLRACFVLDDPNLHTGRYGFVRFEQLARAAAGHHYHVSMAMAPLDGWFAQRGTTRLFREHRPNLSIAIHGNDHLFREMAQARTPELSTRLLAQSLRRSAAFEGRTGVQVCRVMVPPHDSCSELSARHMLRVGFEGICLYGSYPRFFRGAGGGMQTITRPRDPLAGWFPADLTAVAPPVLLRFALESPPDDLPLRAFLGQPLIIGGHHQDLANGPEALTEAARQLNTMGDIRWMSLSDIANSSFSTCRDGDTLRVRMFSRRVQLDVPEGVGRVVIENPRLETIRELELVSGAGSGRIEIRITPRDTLSPVTIAAPAWSARPYVRRLATEGRDRTAPTVLRLRRSTAPLVQRAAASVERRLRRL